MVLKLKYSGSGVFIVEYGCKWSFNCFLEYGKLERSNIGILGSWEKLEKVLNLKQ